MDGYFLITANKYGSAEVLKVDIQRGIDQARIVHRIQIESKLDFSIGVKHPLPHTVVLGNMLYFVHDRFSLVKIDATTLQIIRQENIQLPDSVREKKGLGDVEHFGILKDDSSHSVAVVYNDKQQI